MTTHISDGGYVQKVRQVLRPNDPAPANSQYGGFARLVRPESHYADAPYVEYWWVPGVGIVCRSTE